MQINHNIKKVTILVEKVIFFLLRLFLIVIIPPIMLFKILEKIEDNYYDYRWGSDGSGWNYIDEYYYKASSNLNLIEFSIILLFAIFAHKLPRRISYIVILLFIINNIFFSYCYSIDNPPTWILDVF